ncbi:septum formation initiator family protein [Geminicoccaceae bacterium 1502E]|nr:septum formation initiator family protein [Geminicoccaceae bacterium 1502E]
MPDGLRRFLRQHWLLVLSLLLLFYFGFHAVHGERGLLAWLDVEREIEAVKVEHERLVDERLRLEARVEALQPDRIDPDLLEEQLRKMGYMSEGEVVVLPEGGPPPAPPIAPQAAP